MNGASAMPEPMTGGNICDAKYQIAPRRHVSEGNNHRIHIQVASPDPLPRLWSQQICKFCNITTG